MSSIRFPRLLLVAALAIAPLWWAIARAPARDGDQAEPARENKKTGSARDGNNVAGSLITYPASDFIEQGKGRPGGVLKVSVAVDLQTLDFHVAAGGHWIGRILYDNLVYLDDKGNVTPWLAKSWQISADHKTYTFHLRDDVTFSDGTKFDAEAVRVNLARIRDPATKSAAGASYIDAYVDGKVIDEYTFEAHLRVPYSPFLPILANTFFGMISPKAIRETPGKLAERPITTGPFVIESYERQQSITFVRRSDYRWAPPFIRHEGPAYVDRIEVQFVPEAVVRYSSLVSGQFDVTLDAPPQNAPAIGADPSLVMVNRVMPGNTVRGPLFNVQKAPFDDVRVRKAFALAIDREGIARVVGFGEFYPESDFLSSNMIYYDPSLRNVLKYDVAEANRLLDEAGWTERDAKGYRYKNGVRLSAEVVMSPNSGGGGAGNTELAVVEIQSHVKKIGFELKIVQLPNAQRLALRSSGNYQAMGPSGAYAGNTPAALFLYYHSSQILTDQYIGQNLSRLDDTALDELLDRARQSHDPSELKDLYSKAQRRLIELVPTVPLFDYQVLSAYRKDIQGILFDTSCNRVSFTTAWIDRKP